MLPRNLLLLATLLLAACAAPVAEPEVAQRVDLSLEPERYVLHPGEELAATTRLANQGPADEVAVTLEYRLLDERGETLLFNQSRHQVAGTLQVAPRLTMPAHAATGSYTLEARIHYGLTEPHTASSIIKILEEEPLEPIEEPTEQPRYEAPPEASGPGYTGELLAAFEERTDTYAYTYEDEHYDVLAVVVEKQRVRIGATNELFLVEEGLLVPTGTAAAPSDDRLRDIIDEGEPLANYVWIDAGGRISACLANGSYTAERCVEREERPWIHTDLRWQHPFYEAIDWYWRFYGLEPSEVREDYQHVDEWSGKQYRVDHVLFAQSYRNETKLTVNQRTKFPMRVEKLRDGKRVWKVDYHHVETAEQRLGSQYEKFRG